MPDNRAPDIDDLIHTAFDNINDLKRAKTLGNQCREEKNYPQMTSFMVAEYDALLRTELSLRAIQSYIKKNFSKKA